MKSVGIIGGLGPATTAAFYLDVISSCQKNGSSSRPSIIIANVPIPLKVEREAILENRKVDRFVPFLVGEAKRLEKAGADFIVMPCNSLHIFIEHIRNAVHIPVLSIVEETAAFLKSHNFLRVGMLSTLMTRENRLYEKALKSKGVTCELPSIAHQGRMNSIIHRLVTGQKRSEDRSMLVRVVDDFEKRQVDCVVLACTDLQLLEPKHQTLKIFDTMKILEDATVRAIANIAQS